MKPGDAILYPSDRWLFQPLSKEPRSPPKMEIGLIIEKLNPGRSGELIFKVLCKNGTIEEFMDFELKIFKSNKRNKNE